VLLCELKRAHRFDATLLHHQHVSPALASEVRHFREPKRQSGLKTRQINSIYLRSVISLLEKENRFLTLWKAGIGPLQRRLAFFIDVLECN
jgi:hypothetical protein